MDLGGGLSTAVEASLGLPSPEELAGHGRSEPQDNDSLSRSKNVLFFETFIKC